MFFFIYLFLVGWNLRHFPRQVGGYRELLLLSPIVLPSYFLWLFSIIQSFFPLPDYCLLLAVNRKSSWYCLWALRNKSVRQALGRREHVIFLFISDCGMLLTMGNYIPKVKFMQTWVPKWNSKRVIASKTPQLAIIIRGTNKWKEHKGKRSIECNQENWILDS